MESLSVARIGPPRRFLSMEFHYDREFPTNSTTTTGGFYFSAPTSPIRSSAILSEFAKSIRAVVPFMWEEKPGTPKKKREEEEKEDANEFSEAGSDFEFSAGFGGPNSEKAVLSTAEELFSDGQIRPLRPPPRLRQSFDSDKASGGFKTSASFRSLTPQSPRSPRSPLKEGRRIVREAFWGLTKRGKDKDVDPFAAALGESKEERRGRERSAGRRSTRSCSPLRIFKWKRDDAKEILSKPKFCRRWSLKDFLFRKGRRGWGFSTPTAKQSEKYRTLANQMEYRIV